MAVGFCEDCVFYQALSTTTRPHGLCRVRAPSPKFEDHLSDKTVWPIVEGEDWCGEFQPEDSDESTPPPSQMV